MTQDASIRMRQLKQKNHVVPEEYVRTLHVGPVDWLTYRQRLRAMDSSIGPRKAGIAPKISELQSQLADWAIGRRRGRCAKESDEASRDQ